MENICQKTPLQKHLSQGVLRGKKPFEDVPRNLFAVPVLGFPVSAFIIIMLKRQHFRLYYVETVAFVCTVSDLLSKWYTEWPRATLVLHVGLRLL